MSALKSALPEKEVSILLPAYNEALRIERCVREVERAVSSFSVSYEIIVAEDGSTDGTDKILAVLSRGNPNLSVLHSPVRLGKGKAIKRALHSAKGDVIVFIYAQDPKKDFIKRLIAVEGEAVEIINGTIYVNDKPLTGQVFNSNYYYTRGDYGEAGKKIVVPQNSYFVMGDNSATSQDSRYWGFVPKNNVLGKAILIYWPPQRIRIVK